MLAHFVAFPAKARRAISYSELHTPQDQRAGTACPLIRGQLQDSGQDPGKEWAKQMIVIFGLLFGAALGAFNARRRNGNIADMLQYGAVYAMIFGVIGLAITIGLHRAWSVPGA